MSDVVRAILVFLFIWGIGFFVGFINGWRFRISVERPTINGVQTWCEPPKDGPPAGTYTPAVIHHAVSLPDGESWTKAHTITASGTCGLCKGEAPTSREELEKKADH